MNAAIISTTFGSGKRNGRSKQRRVSDVDEIPHLIDPMKFNLLVAAGAGSLVFLVVTSSLRLGWLKVLARIVVAQITAYYFTDWLAPHLGLSKDATAVLIGVCAFLFWGGVIKVVQSLHDDPLGTVRNWWDLIRGRGGSNSGGTP